MGPGTGLVGTGIAPPGTHPVPYPTPGTPPPRCTMATRVHAAGHCLNMAVGLKSVGQLTLGAVFSGLQGMTEVYNLVETGRINNHFSIPGID